ncbi:MAG: ferrochelatase [Proteobacteria bacterium]|jgi:ferrochelatase|nr:ferrochelatase [Pseudomonadota bacterium]MBP10493.1 ferrochelatase [Acidiferrobacteraceae bacterium]|tara:strand:+ start:843 stop:1859 length:1017 start_codon:yes stop_codon:yes gene_type:complete
MHYHCGVNSKETQRVGILLANLGTPDAPEANAVRRFLSQFLHDRRVVELPRLLWYPILHGLILRVRPGRSAAAYRQIWQTDGSPLLAIARRQSELLQQHFDQRHGDKVQVALGMRYGNPSITSAMQRLIETGVRKLLVLPLYPQYSCSTTASIYDAVSGVLKYWRSLPDLHIIRDYHLDGGYLDALARSVSEHWSRKGQPERLLISFHGTPERYRRNGDPYSDQCHATAEELVARLGLADGQWYLTFQSRFGRAPWLQPYTDKTLEELAKAGVRSVDVVCPGFSGDCLETLEEIDQQNRRIFLAAGGERFGYVPCLNDRPDHVTALAAILEKETAAWL